MNSPKFKRNKHTKKIQSDNWIKILFNEDFLPIFDYYPEKIRWDIYFNCCLNSIHFLKKFGKDEQIKNLMNGPDFYLYHPHLDHYIEKHLDEVRNYSEKHLCGIKHHLSSKLIYIPFLRKYPEFIDYEIICNLETNEIIDILEKNKDKISWTNISKNPCLIDFLLENIDKINWLYFMLNTHPKAIQIIEQNPEKINWNYLSANRSAVHLLKKNEKIIDDQNIRDMMIMYNDNVFSVMNIQNKIFYDYNNEDYENKNEIIDKEIMIELKIERFHYMRNLNYEDFYLNEYAIFYFMDIDYELMKKTFENFSSELKNKVKLLE